MPPESHLIRVRAGVMSSQGYIYKTLRVKQVRIQSD
ncbi:hypothetical protein LAh6_162 [Aeromonas phage LAh_6]|uniref:Uncharacterized protein n=1 Tax=Aeromonas phage LAh_6 TaxID=2591030 RepID=A0A514A030_9CAUD|nr:hypothetical protein HWC30_gp162 [Aeromonas phage LAh_6]QDH46638.1 hypothetical protein LAh6_162 [Aeromonas phage LAh_6]